MDLFVKNYVDKYPEASKYLLKDEEKLLAFYAFPSAHWKHLRTSKPQGCLSRRNGLGMIFKLALCAQQGWRKLNKPELLVSVLNRDLYADGEIVKHTA